MTEPEPSSDVAVQDEVVETKGWQRVAWAVFSTLMGLLLLSALVLTVWGWFEGGPKPQGRIAPAVFDDARLLGPEAILAIQQTMLPADVPLVVRTIDSSASAVLGAAATDRMEHEPYWQTVSPRTWHQRTVKRNPPWAKGVYILVSRRPALLQVRFGEQIRLEAYRAGLAAGPRYRQMQDTFTAAPTDAQVVAIVADIAKRLPAALESPWYLSLAKRLMSTAYSEIEEFVLPAEGAFRHWALRLYVGVLQRLGAAASGWRFLGFTALCYIVLWSAAYALSATLGKRFKVVGAIAGVALSILAKVVYLIGAIGSLMLLANGRLEDELLLRDLGLQQYQWAGFNGPYFSMSGGWFLAIATAVIAFFASFLETMEQLEESRRQGNTEINLGFLFAPIAWGALVLFLPRAIGLFALFNRMAAGVGAIFKIAKGLE